jgi:hypothetical protein
MSIWIIFVFYSTIHSSVRPYTRMRVRNPMRVRTLCVRLNSEFAFEKQNLSWLFLNSCFFFVL